MLTSEPQDYSHAQILNFYLFKRTKTINSLRGVTLFGVHMSSVENEMLGEVFDLDRTRQELY